MTSFDSPKAHFYEEGCFFKTLDDIRGKKITVMGLGLNGGGVESVKFLARHGALVTVTDLKSQEELKSSIQEIEADKSFDSSKIRYVLGRHCKEDFSGADCVIKNPAVKYDKNEFLPLARAIETDISIFLHFTKSKIVAVTGSKGKSSTVSALRFGLENAGFKVFLGGNITVSPLSFLDELLQAEKSKKSKSKNLTNSQNFLSKKNIVVVLELSSWQLADLRGRRLLKPKIAIITKIIPDHQNFYHSMLSYVEDKKLIFAAQTKSDWTILDWDDDPSADGGTLIENWGDIFAKETKAKVLRYSTSRLPKNISGAFQNSYGEGFFQLNGKTEKILGKLNVPGKHMKINVLNAAMAMRILGVDAKSIQKILENWNGIEHRLEFFHSWKFPNCEKNFAVKFYNDSTASVPEAAAAASQAFNENVIFIAGGTDKGLSFDALSDCLSPKNLTTKKPLAIYLLKGSATQKIVQLFEQEKICYNGIFENLDSLLLQLKIDIEKFLPQNFCVVFSPGATSFELFENEFDRGKKFKQKVISIF